MEIKEITNKDEWEGFLLQCAEKTFLQSWNWGEFNSQMGQKIWRFGAYNNGKLIGVAMVSKISARRGAFLFIPHGPVFLDGLVARDRKDVLELFLLHFSDISKKDNVSFIRVSRILVEI